MTTKYFCTGLVLAATLLPTISHAGPHSFWSTQAESSATFIDDCDRSCTTDQSGTLTCTRTRKEVGDLSPQEWRRYVRAFLAAKQDPKSPLQSLINLYTPGFFSRGLHNNGAFLPWHRGYLLQVENALQEQDCRVTVPYWNWDLSPTKTGGDSELTDVSADSYDELRNRLEHGPGLHDSVHCLVGGTMCSARSSNDPIFFTHHANIDKIWSEWQSLTAENQNAHTGRIGLLQWMPRSTMTPADVLDITDLPGDVSVEYDPASGYSDIED